jgi:hypothetical protein
MLGMTAAPMVLVVSEIVEAITLMKVVGAMKLVPIMVIAVGTTNSNVLMMVSATTDVKVSAENSMPTKIVIVILLVSVLVIAVETTKKNVLVLVKDVPVTVVDKLTKDVGVIPLVLIMVIAAPTTKKNV